MNEKITHEIQGRNPNGLDAQTGATGTRTDLGGYFNQLDVSHTP
jgi:hypothetical protein